MNKVLHKLHHFFLYRKRLWGILCIGLLLLIPLELFIYSTNSTEEDELYWKTFLAHTKTLSVPIPNNLQFAGERVPLFDFTVYESMERELVVNTYFHSQSILMHKRANRWFPMIEKILKKNGVPDDFKYISLIESNLSNVVSPKGATGFWQLLSGTAREYGLEVNREVDERYHVEKATEAACKYILKAYKRFGNWTLAAASYNIGMEGLKKQLEKQKASTYYDLSLNSETARYIFRLLAVKEVISNPKQYGFIFRKKDLYPFIKTKTIHIDSTITNFADFASEHKISYKILKYFNPWLKKPTLTNKNKKSYLIQIPLEGYNEEYISGTSHSDTLENNNSNPTAQTDSLLSTSDTLNTK